MVFQQSLGHVEIPRLPRELPEIKAEAQPIRLAATFIAAKGNIPVLTHSPKGPDEPAFDRRVPFGPRPVQKHRLTR